MIKVYPHFILSALISFALVNAAFAQDEQATPQISGRGRQAPAIGHFYGRIIDAKTHKGIDGASVQLVMQVNNPVTKTRQDSIVRGMITSKKGDFSFTSLSLRGTYQLNITAIGYKIVNAFTILYPMAVIFNW